MGCHLRRSRVRMKTINEGKAFKFVPKTRKEFSDAIKKQIKKIL